MFRMIYPEEKMVSDDRIKGWAADKMADEGEIPGFLEAIEKEEWDLASKLVEDHKKSLDVFEAMAYLEDLGDCTFSNS